MKKFCLLLFILSILCNPVLSDENSDLWSDYNVDVTGGKEATAVSDEEFEQAIKKIDSKVNKWRNWAQKRKRPKGQEFSQSNETDILNKEHGQEASLPVISLPVEIYIGDNILPVGHYQVKGEIENNLCILNLYQSGELISKIAATETNDDFNQNEILFAAWEPIDDERIKIIYGSLEFNAYAVVNVKL